MEDVEGDSQYNIKTIATNDPVLGGSWYVISIETVPSYNKGVIVYEDGHIQSKANFEYTYKEYAEEIKVTKFEIIEQ